MKRAIGATVLALLAASSSWAQSPPSGKPPAEEYPEKLNALYLEIANRHADIGEYLAKEKQFEWAFAEFGNAIKFVPNHERANKGKGYTKWSEEERAWVINPDGPKFETKNLKRADEADRIRKKYQDDLEKLRKDVAAKYASLAAWCEKSLKEKAQENYRKAIEYDALNKTARGKLGHKKIGGVWMSKEEEALRKEMKGGIAKAPKGQADPSPADVEDKTGIPMKLKMSTENVKILSPHMDVKTAEALLQHAQHAYTMFHKIFNQSNLVGEKIDLVILQNKAQHEKYVDAYGSDLSPEYKKLCKDSHGFGDEMWQGDDKQEEMEDWVIHKVIMNCSRSLGGGDRHWLHEGLAYYFTKLMHDSTHSHCTDMRNTGPGQSTKSYTDGSTWHIVIKEWIGSGKGEPSIEEVFKATKLSELTGGEPVKAWSLCEFLATDHRDRYIEFMQKVRASKREEDDKVFQEVFGWSLTELDERWRVYARGAFVEVK